MCVTFLLSSVVTGTRRYFKGNKVFLNADFSLYQKRNQNYTRFLKTRFLKAMTIVLCRIAKYLGHSRIKEINGK